MKNLKYGYIKRNLQFSFEAQTSRGKITEHASYLVWVCHPSNNTVFGWGEASPLKGLSVDATHDFEDKLAAALTFLSEGHLPVDLDLSNMPSLRFAIETAQMDLFNGGKQMLFNNTFSKGIPIPINGLVWMNEVDKMLDQAIEKANAGYSVIKFKVGANKHEDECRMLEQFRKQCSANKIQIRLDANGAYLVDEALPKLKELYKYEIHSIEQPIATKQYEALEEICGKSLIAIALDEELIGLNPEEDGAQMLKKIKAQYLIIKPTLLGGLSSSAKWVRKAEENGMDWWATSALESNVGLNAIAQWTSVQRSKLPHGLGTGELYKNNIESPLVASKGELQYISFKPWKLPIIK